MKHDTDIEILVSRGKNLSLRADEKDSIKLMLLTHAAQTIAHEEKPVLSPWTPWVLRASLSFASLILIFTGTAYASQDSLPGEPLYAMKVHVVEEIVSLTKLSTEDKIAYDTELLSRRLEELQLLTLSEESIEPAALEEIAEQINDHVTHTTEVIANSSDETLAHESKIDALVIVNSITKAQSIIVESNQTLATISDSITYVDESASNILMDTVEDFVNENTSEEVNSYLSEQITDISNQIQATTTDQISEFLNEADEALEEGRTDIALTSILEAQETIDADSLIEQVAESASEETP
jgi:hypothetical protein